MTPATQWYLKLAVVGSVIGASMELFMNYTGFYDKVVTLEAQQRLEALHASREALQTSDSNLSGSNTQ
ncbi:hypothetical protein Mp_3g18610 [Marchantia polymorpha subsp. ruderalis]|uniref:Uncharacterized protein n=2 Tax=Marchantia polymorpha TaxID=3197 RepID=A0AAF6B293_MARPO|nr:hypothetical protein MARPO_0142s0032 [Marchantia polymorpha]BBN06127.1 hypothetical protein Mp_3g18610 [Marchantia polymorpha subsp. ruderalis]|eukprot:PTQ29405.1 hypothetical protein MARPO_0142s0032 [Marchantia polymorpha]